MWRLHITSRPEIQLVQMRAAHKQTELLNAIHHVLKSSRVSRIEYDRTKLATLSAASSRAKADFLCVIPSANLNPVRADCSASVSQRRIPELQT